MEMGHFVEKVKDFVAEYKFVIVAFVVGVVVGHASKLV